MSVLGWIIIALIAAVVLVAVVKAIAIAVIVMVTCKGDGGVKGQKNPRWVQGSDTWVGGTENRP